MPKSNSLQAVDRLVFLVNSGNVEPLKNALAEFEQCGLQKDKLINYPIQRYNGRTVVHLAASNGLVDCLGLLLKNGGNPNAVSSPPDLSQTPLHLASSMGFPQCIEVLLANGARLDIKNTRRETAYNLVRGKVKCERMFQHAIARFQIPQRNNEQQARVEALHELVGESVDQFCDLYDQLQRDHMDLATRWTDFFQQTLLYRATSNNQFEVIKFMLSRSPHTPLHNLDTNETPLIAACLRDNLDIARLLLEHSPKLVFIAEARNNLTPFHVACSRGNLCMVDLILETIKVYIYSDDYDSDSEMSLDFRDQLGRTPLFNACYYGFHDIVKVIVNFYKEHSSRVTLNVNAAVKNTSRTPLHVAVRKGNMDTIRLLLSVMGVDLSLEARPSGRTQGRLLSVYQKVHQGDAHSKMSSLGDMGGVDGEWVDGGGGAKDGRKKSDVVEIDMREEQERLFTPDLTSPPGTRTPIFSTTSSSTYTDSWKNARSGDGSTSSFSSSSISPLHIDDSVGIMAPSPSAFAGRKSSGECLPKDGQYGSLQRRRAKTSTMGEVQMQKMDAQLEEMDSNRKRSRTEEPVEAVSNAKLVIYECKKTGKLDVFKVEKNSSDSGYRNFNSIFMTCLAEAVACGHSKVAKFLLSCGARDESGLACRIAHFIKKFDLMQNILAYHTMLRDSSFRASSVKMDNTGTGTASGDGSIEAELCLELQWSYKQLAVCDGKWLSSSAKFYPHMSKDQEERREMMLEEVSLRSRSDRDTDSTSSEVSLDERLSLASHPTVAIESLRIIQLDNNQLQTLPIELFRLHNVKRIDLSHNKLLNLPSSASGSGKEGSSTGWACPNLEELNLSSNSLAYLPWCVWGLPSLRTFRCSKNKLTSIYPDSVMESDEILTPCLETVDLSQNLLRGTFPGFVFELPGLKTLNLSDNQIEDLPTTLWETDILQDLNVSNNALVYLPLCEPENDYRDSVCLSGSFAPVSMKQADVVLVGKAAIRAPKIDYNKSLYRQTPSTIRAISSVEDMSWNNASVSNAAVVHTCDYSSLQKLNISGNKISIFPEALACFAPNLQELDVSRNLGLKEIDLLFVPFSLKKLTAKKCGLERIGNVATKKHQSLAVANCRHGEDTGRACTHRSHSRLPWLTTLILAQNKIPHLQLIRQAQPEVSLDLFDRVESVYQPKIAPSLDLLYPALEGFNMSNNHLVGMFNPNIGHHTHLKWVHLNGNPDLTGVPMEFAYLKNTKMLTELKISDLPNLIEPPVEYQTVGLNHLLTYMRSRLKESDYYRSIKLFFVGNGKRGKTTLLRRLRGMPEDKKVERTAGIDIESWVYPEQKKFLKDKRKPVKFLAWDFAGQDVYHTTHQCFYSKRSMYMALYRLIDGEAGINELDPWLRNVQLRAPGCPVVIVGTHLDCVQDQNRVRDLETKVKRKYKGPQYPKVVYVTSICCYRKLIGNKMEELRKTLYDIACHLSLGRDGILLEYKPDMEETNAKALFQQQIPCTFLALQEKIAEKVAEMKKEERPPIMEEAEFRSTFKGMVEDDEELLEAVFFLNLQGTLLHFEDHHLKQVYFLDPEWLAKLMADVIHPAAVGRASHIHEGVAEISGLFCHRDTPSSTKEHYLSLLEKFEVALRINPTQMIIPSLMPDRASYPQPSEQLSDITSSLVDEVETSYHPPLRRFWLADYMPAGFWPRLICRVATDPQIDRVLQVMTGATDTPSRKSSSSSIPNSSPSHSNSLQLPTSPPSAGFSGRKSPSICLTETSNLKITPWKTGLAFSCRGHTLLVMTQTTNKPCEKFLEDWGTRVKVLRGEYRIEIHIYTNEWIKLAGNLAELDFHNLQIDNPDSIPGLATKLLVMLTNHVKTLATGYFTGMLNLPRPGVFSSYVPCWKCFAEIGSAKALVTGAMKGKFVCKDGNPVSTFILEEHIVTAALGQPLECCIHCNLKIIHMMPDLTFLDLSTDMMYQDSSTPLHICEDEVLGKGGFGFVCKGELRLTADNMHQLGTKKNVAVKFFLEDVSHLMEVSSISELLDKSKDPHHLLYAYREIRQEVSFLSNLAHPNLAELCGVRTSPYLCLMLELAPKKSLRTILKEYKDYQLALEPLTLKTAAIQIAQGLEFLHGNQVVHLDMKSPNVLLWHFPSPHLSRPERVQQASKVWLKIADYGISQSGLSLRVDNSPVGTPGFMAPELFEKAGQVVSSEKVDVFAYGMVLFELLTQRTPFVNVQPPVKRNHEVKDGRRPTLEVKETRSILLLQELMFICWNQDPEGRPRMEQVVQWIQAPEFERLRAEISLDEVKSISCACVCRIRPEYEKSEWEENVDPYHNSSQPIYNRMVDFDKLQNDNLGEIGNLDSLVEEYGNGGIDVIVENMLPSVSLESVCIEDSKGKKITAHDEDVYQFVPSRQGGSRTALYRDTHQRKNRLSGRRGKLRRKMKQEAEAVSENEGAATNFDPYTQIWMCGRDQRKGLLQIFTFNDDHSGFYHFSGYCSRDEITSMCPVRNMMWMGTTSGSIKVFHAPTLKVKFTCTLEREGPEGTTNRTILDILYVEEMRSVLVANFSGEVWSFYDSIVDDGLRLQCKITLADDSPCYHLTKVLLDDGKLEVWGTMENNRLLLLQRTAKSSWKHSHLTIDPKEARLRLCSHIAAASFTKESGESARHMWISYRQKSVLVSFDAHTKEQRCILNCADKLKSEMKQPFQVTNLICYGREVIVGSSVGNVAIFDSETTSVLRFFSWHKDKVRMLLLMPPQVEPCICAEVPFQDQDLNEAEGGNEQHGMGSPSLGMGRRRLSPKKTPKHVNGHARNKLNFSNPDNEKKSQVSELESCMITSIGNGKSGYSVHMQSKEDQVQIFNRMAVQRSAYKKGSRAQGDDIVLRIWRT